MSPDKPTTGYPPVTEAEVWQARASVPSGHLSASEKTITDAMAGVIEKHRAEIAAAPIARKTRRYALDFLDVVFPDVLQTVLNESSALEVLREMRRARH